MLFKIIIICGSLAFQLSLEREGRKKASWVLARAAGQPYICKRNSYRIWERLRLKFGIAAQV